MISCQSSIITVLDDEPSIREMLKLRLEREGYQVLTAGNYEEFKDVMTADCDIVLCDIILPGNNGLQALEWSKKHFPHTPVIIMTGKPSYETAAEAIRSNAYDYLAKPVKKDELLLSIERAIQHRRLSMERERLQGENDAYRLHLEQRIVEQTKALHDSETFLANLTNTMADAVISLRMSNYQISYANKTVYDVFGYRPEELLEKSLDILYIDSAQFAGFKRQQTAAIENQQPQLRFEEAMLKKDGQTVWIEMVTTFIHNEDQSSQIICVIRDISQRSLLLGVVAHELRSPLSLVTGFSQALIKDITEIDRQSLAKYLGVIEDTANHMLRMVDELLDITEIQLGEVALQFEWSDLAKLLKKQIDEYAIVAQKKGISFKLSLRSTTLICQCDPGKISQVISNFADNAIKFSDPDTCIEVIGKQTNDHIWIGVKDQGPGIQPEEYQHLFKSFSHTKISSKPTGGEKSSGLGLAISKNIIEAHKGRIGVDSGPGPGATFWFSLPVER